jgi:hypothetical protein
MITFDRINRRTHLYLGMILVPWIVMYGFSSFVMNHRYWFLPAQEAAWQPVFERAYQSQNAIPDQGDVRTIAAEILRDNNLEGVFFVQRPGPGELRITRTAFFSQIRATYLFKENRLKVERQAAHWDMAVIRMHVKGGYNQPLFINKLWAVIVDVACIAILIWIASGLIMWWRLTRTRTWGFVALGAGAMSFLLLVWKL